MTRPITIRDEVAGGFVKRLKGPDPPCLFDGKGGFFAAAFLFDRGALSQIFCLLLFSLIPHSQSSIVRWSGLDAFLAEQSFGGAFHIGPSDRLEYGLVS